MRIKFSAVCALVIAARTALGLAVTAPAAELGYGEVVASAFAGLSDGRGGFFEGLKFGGSDWAAFCAARLGGEYAEGAEEYVADVKAAAEELIGRDFVPPTELQRAAVVLSGFGECPEELINAAAYDNQSLDRQGLNAWIWALTAANCFGGEAGSGAANTRKSLAEHIAAAALPDGGFTLRGESADCDMTAAAIYALAPLGDEPEVSAALAAATDCLAGLQLENGGFRSMGVENCESAAQAIIAFTAVGCDLGDSRVERAFSAMLEYRTEGGFAHTVGGKANGSATAQALQAAAALAMRERGERLFDAPSAYGGYGEITGESAVPPPTAEETGGAGIIPADGTEPSGFAITLIISVCFAAAGAAAVVIGAVKRKKGALIASAALLAAAGGVWLLDIRSPSEYYSQANEGDMRVTVSADCSAALAAMDKIDEEINPASVIPEDGMVIACRETAVAEGATAFDALVAAARGRRVAVDYVGSFYGVYVRGIGHIYEFGFGDMSGWTYTVNGESPDVSAGEFVLSEGDRVEFVYTVG